MSLTPRLTDAELARIHAAETARLRDGIHAIVARLDNARTLRHCQLQADLRALLDGDDLTDF